MNIKNVIVILCFVMGLALAIQIPNDDRFGLKEKKERKKHEKRSSKKEKKNSAVNSCPGPYYEEYKGMRQYAADHCFEKQAGLCPKDMYRRQDGFCNNYEFPTWGGCYTQYVRLMPNTWKDNISEPKEYNKPGSDPQNVRRCKVHLLPVRTNPDKKLTVNVMSIGQFAAHDTSLSYTFESECCPIKTENQDECWSVDIPFDDEIYEDNKGCMPVHRVKTTKHQGCKVEGGPQQINKNSPLIDLNIILGCNPEESEKLRNKNGSLLVRWLKNKYGHVGEYFLNSDNIKKDCSGNYPNETICFKTGDERVNQNPWLTVIHIIFLREFNRVVERLHEINPHWNAERLYQEARQIVIAEWQKIIAYDWLPYILGGKKTEECGLGAPKPGERSHHDEKLNPATTRESNDVAMRVLHTLIPDYICLDEDWYPEYENCKERVYLKDWFNRAGYFIPDYLKQITRSLCSQHCKENDKSISSAIADYLFKLPYHQYGQDLSTTDMKRGRETGVGTYNDLREFCGLGRIKSFDEFSKFGPDVVETLKECYNTTDDIDGITGVTRLEDPMPEAVVGPTAGCIIAEQFKRWRFGDSWWYDGEKNKNRFSDPQLKEIRKVNLAKIYCDNSNDLEKVQPNIWIVPGEGNELRPCSDYYSINLELWKEVPEATETPAAPNTEIPPTFG